MGKIANPHDTFVRGLLADKQLAIDYFKSALPAHIADKLDFGTLSPLQGTYVSKELQTTIADVVYTCQRKDRRGSVHISLLLEHKSAPDIYTPVQIGGYLFSGYQLQIQQRRKKRSKQPLSPIIPVLFYHGKQKWAYWTLDKLFADLDAELLGYLPKFDYIYHDLRGTPDEVIKAIDNRFLVSSLLMLKHAFEELWLSQNFTGELAVGLEYGSGVLQQSFLVYYFGRAKFTPKQLEEMLKDFPLTIKDTVMSTYDMIIEKGAEQKSYGVVKNLIVKLGFTDEQAADVAEVSVDFVRKVRSAIEKKK